MVKKSKDAYRNIREVSDHLDLEQQVLRFWESKFDSFKPMTLGGGRRFYSPEDIELIQTIRELLYGRGLTIKAASRLIAAHGHDAPQFAVANDSKKQTSPKGTNAKKVAAPISASQIKALHQIENLLSALEHRARIAIMRCDEILENMAMAAR